MAHDINGPSQLKKRELCPGSAKAESEIKDAELMDDELPENPAEIADFRARGNLGHAWMAAAIRGKTTPPLTEDLAEPCAIAFDMAQNIVNVVGNLRPLPEGKPIVLVEHRVSLGFLGIPEDGTIDYALVWPGVLGIMLDWKFGVVWTDNPRWNRQVQGYVCGLANDFALPEVWGGIGQPDLAPDLRCRISGFDQRHIHAAETDIKRIIAWTKVADPPLRPGKHCMFCAAKDACQARQEYGAQLSVIKSPAGVFFAGDPASRRVLWEKLNIAIKTLETAKEKIVGLMVSDRSVTMDGYEVGSGRGKRVWKNDDVAMAALMALVSEKGGDPEMVAPRKLVSPAEAEKLVGKAKKVQERLEPLIEKVPGDLTIVPEKAKTNASE